ncbi:HlyD family efflux transporter periplasmic adaptor subunit [Maribacter sp. TH_r10]|uniref:HlyD family secretion protein n=1 Tax=Maribacter sp. TH_r10 TaxID=3082086 RepID=UPI002954D714|nr:HlyD family efflux transporter periplasmic adaptor subunit [Maribacter sp. TH_r10]MDV7139856.1 HlyD family efflux transporter periplasmic adaptor subunit [Maribacter sp. TH_r10]
MKKSIFILALLTGILFTSCNGNGEKADGYGNFEATETTISSEANGKLLFFSVEEGQLLKKDDIVGVVDTIQLSLKKAQLLANKKSVFSKSRNVLSQREVIKEQLKVAQNDHKRIENLIKENAATQKQLDDINGQIEILKQQMISVETQNTPIVTEVKSIEVQIQQIEDQIKKSIIQNPLKGTVLTKYAEPHEITAFGKPLYKIANLDVMELRVYLSETQLADIEIGNEVTVKIDANDCMKSYKGEVSWVSDTAEFTPKIIQTKEERVNLVYAVKVLVKNDGSLKIGMPAEIWILNNKE